MPRKQIWPCHKYAKDNPRSSLNHAWANVSKTVQEIIWITHVWLYREKGQCQLKVIIWKILYNCSTRDCIPIIKPSLNWLWRRVWKVLTIHGAHAGHVCSGFDRLNKYVFPQETTWHLVTSDPVASEDWAVWKCHHLSVLGQRSTNDPDLLYSWVFIYRVLDQSLQNFTWNLLN